MPEWLSIWPGNDARPFQPPAKHEGVLTEIRAGLSYIAGTPGIMAPLLLLAAIIIFAMNFNVIVPLYAKNVFYGDPPRNKNSTGQRFPPCGGSPAGGYFKETSISTMLEQARCLRLIGQRVLTLYR